MYSKPTTDADVVSQAIYGSPVMVTESPDAPAEWLRIRTSDDYYGWVPSRVLMAPAARAAEVPEAPAQVRVQVDSVAAHVYREADVTKHEPMLTLPFEAVLDLADGRPLDTGERWLEVQLLDGRRGWIQAGDVARVGRLLDVGTSIALARRFLGVTYTWGGRSSFGFDCSGFTQMLMRSRGILMPRDAQPQADWEGLVPIDADALQPGDLLFFGRSATRITHTGYYVGGGQFIHDTTSGRPGVQISSLEEERWRNMLVAQRRARPRSGS
jgi:hypothetical protein